MPAKDDSWGAIWADIKAGKYDPAFSIIIPYTVVVFVVGMLIGSLV